MNYLTYMDSYDGAQLYDLIGIYILDNLHTKLLTVRGIYRSDGLFTLIYINKHNLEIVRKKLIRLFSELGLCITEDTNFLDITLDLYTNKLKLYNMLNNKLS